MVDHLSYSSTQTYLSCPRSWRFHYLDQIETPKSAALVFGSAFHNTIEERVKTTSQGDMLSLVERWQQHWTAQLKQTGEISWDGDTPEAMCNLGVRMLSDSDIAALINSLKPALEGEKPQIELSVTLIVPGVPIPVIGFVDMIEQDGVPCDFKTSARSWSQERAQTDMQPAFYLAALNQMGYRDPELRFRHYVFLKTKKPQVQIWETQRTWRDMFYVFELVSGVWKAIESGVFIPHPGGWKCSEKYCEYWGICRGGK